MESSTYSKPVPAGVICRKDFGPGFAFGSATSAFQIEGGQRRDGRGPSIFDTFAQELDLFARYGEDAVNHREHYKKDVKLLKEIGFDAYRFSISWSRVMPTGKKESRNQAGIDFYKDLLRNLREEGIEAMVTLVHFDPPQGLEDKYDTFLRREIVNDFRDYAELCFEEFGKDVKYWLTINAPWFVAYGGYITGDVPPGYRTNANYEAIQEEAEKRSGRKIIPHDDHHHHTICPPVTRPIGSSPTKCACETPKDAQVLPPREEWPYIVAYHQILAHAEAAKLYKEKYQQIQGGQIGLHMVAQHYIPLTDSPEDKAAAERAFEFLFGWFMEPLYSGDYPETMRKYVTKGHLREFSAEEKQLIKGSYDFVSMNYYTAMYVSHLETEGGDYVKDRRVDFSAEDINGELLGSLQGAGGWINAYPRGLLEVLRKVKAKYGDPEIIIAENGIDDEDDDSTAHIDSIHDVNRRTFLHEHLEYLREAIREGVKVKGHFVWSLLDNLELASGFRFRFGIVYVDYDDENSRRIPKLSSSWYKSFLTK